MVATKNVGALWPISVITPVAIFTGEAVQRLLSNYSLRLRSRLFAEQVAEAATTSIGIIVRDTLALIGLVAYMFLDARRAKVEV